MLKIKIALVGNPNCGKSTLFNRLTGSGEYVGNRPGVTVKVKEKPSAKNQNIIVADTPGVYSLSPVSPDEVAAFRYITEQSPDVIINLADSRNIRRSLYLTFQLAELGIPMIFVLNNFGVRDPLLHIDFLAAAIGISAFEIDARRCKNPDFLIHEALCSSAVPPKQKIYPEYIEKAALELEMLFDGKNSSRFFAIELLKGSLNPCDIFGSEKATMAQKIIKKAEKENDDILYEVARARHKYCDKAANLSGADRCEKSRLSQKIDRVVLNRFFAFPIFFALIFVIYYFSISIIGSLSSDFFANVFFNKDFAVDFFEKINCAQWLSDLICNALFGATGTVLSFIPQIFSLFFLLSLLEESGYTARIAFLFDRIFKNSGLSGKSVISFFVGSGCSVTGMLSARTIENSSQRKLTVMLTPFIPCSAKVTVISLVAGNAFLSRSLTLFFAYLFAAISIFLSAKLFSKMTPHCWRKARRFCAVWRKKLRSCVRIGFNQRFPEGSFVLEMPPYMVPSVLLCAKKALLQSLNFAKKAATVILISSVVLWFLSSFSVTGTTIEPAQDFCKSILGSFSKGISPFFAPLGFGNAQAVSAVISGLFAKENIIATLALFSSSAPKMNTAQALSFLCFNLFCPPCIAAVSTMKAELSNRKLTIVTLVFQLAFAYVISFLLYRLLCVIAA